MWLCWKVAGTTNECMVVLQSRGKDFLLLLKLYEARISKCNLNCYSWEAVTLTNCFVPIGYQKVLEREEEEKIYIPIYQP